MPTESEEVVVDPHAVEPQDLDPEPRQQLLQRRARGGERRDLPLGLDPAPSQLLPIHLAVGGERQLRDHGEGRGNHVIRQALPQLVAQPDGVHVRRGGGHPGHQPALPCFALHHDRRLLRARDGMQRGLDLGKLDAEAADLHLGVTAAQELQSAVRLPARQVAGPVEAGPGRTAHRIGHEALGREVRPAHVPPRQTVAAGAQLSGHPCGHWPEGVVQQEHRGVGDWSSDGDGRGAGARRVRRGHRMARREGGPLGGSVAVDQTHSGEARQGATHGRGGEHIAARQELAHLRQSRESLLDHLVEEAGREPERGHAVARQQRPDLLKRRHTRRRQDQAAAGQKRAPDLQRRSVE
jgi:hypothetical protein